MIINCLYLIYKKIYVKMKSKYCFIISLTLIWISLITLVINLYTLIKLSVSFQIFRKNVNDLFYYSYNNTDNNSYVNTYKNFNINDTDNIDNDVDYETKIISKNEYNNLGNFSSEINSLFYLIFFCAILLILIVIIFKYKKENEGEKKLNKSNINIIN